MVLGNLAAVMGASDKLCEIMEYVPEINCSGGDKLPGDIKGNLELRNVKFRYPGKPDV